MSAAVIRLPTAPPDFIAVRWAGRCWIIELVTPCEGGGKPLRTTLVRTNSRAAAVEEARQTAARMQRPVKLPLATGGAA